MEKVRVTTHCLTPRRVQIKVIAARGQNVTQLMGPWRYINIGTCYEHYIRWNVTKDFNNLLLRTV